MATISLFVGKEKRDKRDVEAILLANGDGSFSVQLLNYPKGKLMELLQPAEVAEIDVFIDAKRYKVTALVAEGKFTAVPDFPLR